MVWNLPPYWLLTHHSTCCIRVPHLILLLYSGFTVGAVNKKFQAVFSMWSCLLQQKRRAAQVCQRMDVAGRPAEAPTAT